MKLINKIKKANHGKKTDIWYDANMTSKEITSLVREMILSLPGEYKLHSREYGENLIDKIFEVYGTMPSMSISENLLLGMQILYPKNVRVSFTHDMDSVVIAK